MTHYAALDVSQKATAVCVVDETGKVIRTTKLPACPGAIASWLAKKAAGLVRVGMETGPLAVWLWNELHARGCRSCAWMPGTQTRRSGCA
jgi:transposase